VVQLIKRTGNTVRSPVMVSIPSGAAAEAQQVAMPLAVSVPAFDAASASRVAPSASPADSAPPRPHLKIRPVNGWALLNFTELWSFRDLLWTMAGRDLKLRYRQTALGAIWVVL